MQCIVQCSVVFSAVSSKVNRSAAGRKLPWKNILLFACILLLLLGQQRTRNPTMWGHVTPLVTRVDQLKRQLHSLEEEAELIYRQFVCGPK